MSTQTLDPVKYAYVVCERLLASHEQILAKKNIYTTSELLQLIKIDFEKTIHALLEVRNKEAHQMVRAFFEGHEEIVSDIEPAIGRHLYHFGFEIYEPLDVVLYGFERWIERSKQILGIDIKVSKFLRFPASAQFQKRVGAYTEIMRIWLQVEERELMLELFDIYRPARPFLPESVAINTRNIQALLSNNGFFPHHDDVMRKLFAKDNIWHYAIYVTSQEKIWKLHNNFSPFVLQNDAYKLAYDAPVLNKHDGSFHTKIINQVKGLEIEFVTQFRNNT